MVQPAAGLGAVTRTWEVAARDADEADAIRQLGAAEAGAARGTCGLASQIQHTLESRAASRDRGRVCCSLSVLDRRVQRHAVANPLGHEPGTALEAALDRNAVGCDAVGHLGSVA